MYLKTFIVFLVFGTNFINNSFNHATVTLTNVLFPANAQFRFQCDANDNSDLIYIDQVKVTGSTAALRGTQSIIGQTCEQVGIDKAGNEMLIYPNPAKNSLSVQSAGSILYVKLYDVNGVVVKQFASVNEGTVMNIAELKSGVYIIRFKTSDGSYISRKFVKQ